MFHDDSEKIDLVTANKKVFFRCAILKNVIVFADDTDFHRRWTDEEEDESVST